MTAPNTFLKHEGDAVSDSAGQRVARKGFLLTKRPSVPYFVESENGLGM